MHVGGHVGDRPKVRFKDEPTQSQGSSWMPINPQMQQAIALGRQNRLKNGSGLDVLQENLRNGSQPDLIELSKKRSMRVW